MRLRGCQEVRGSVGVGLTSTHSASAWSAGAMTVPSGSGLLSQFFERGAGAGSG